MDEQERELALQDNEDVLSMADELGSLHRIKNGHCDWTGLPEDECGAQEEIAAAHRLVKRVERLGDENRVLRRLIASILETGSLELHRAAMEDLDSFIKAALTPTMRVDCDHSQHPDPCGHKTDYPGTVLK